MSDKCLLKAMDRGRLGHRPRHRFGDRQIADGDVRQVLDAAFERATRSGADAIVVLGNPLIYAHRARVADLAARQRLPAVYFFSENVDAGGLMSYGPSLYDLGRRAATYVEKILKGALPADLPVEQPTKFNLVINLKTAKALGLVISPAILRQAERVIE